MYKGILFKKLFLCTN